MGIGRKIGSFEPKRFSLGQGGSSLPPGIEEGCIGMKKKSVRFLCIPPLLTTEANVWGPHVPADATLLVEITIMSVRSPDEVTHSLTHLCLLPHFIIPSFFLSMSACSYVIVNCFQ
jgi:hypothetical protein